MKKTGLIYLGALLAVGAMSIGSGCGSDTGTGGSGGTGASGGSGGTGGTGGSSSSSSSSSSSGTVAATCDTYCATIMANCTGATKQYNDDAQCKAVCATFPKGTVGEMANDSIECRAYHAGAAKTDAALHCNHAGISGGDVDPTDATAAACGDGCEAFCNLTLTTCTGTNDLALWGGNKDKCIDTCKGFPVAKDTFDVSDLGGNSFNCHLYHAMATIADPDTHCDHAINLQYCQ